jgi:hypothetical protein
MMIRALLHGALLLPRVGGGLTFFFSSTVLYPD